MKLVMIRGSRRFGTGIDVKGIVKAKNKFKLKDKEKK
jgi:hypothetical protein